MQNEVALHYDKLIEESNDPVKDPPMLQSYMDQWDGQVFIDKMGLSAEKSVLEIGVGTGRIAVRVAPLCKDFTGIDLSPKTVDRAKEHLASFENVTLICANFLSYSFKKSFDVIYSSLTFMHFSDKEQVIEKIRHLLYLNGRFVLSIDKNQDRFIDMGTRKIAVYPDDPNHIKQILQNMKFRIVETIETEHAFLFIADKT